MKKVLLIISTLLLTTGCGLNKKKDLNMDEYIKYGNSYIGAIEKYIQDGKNSETYLGENVEYEYLPYPENSTCILKDDTWTGADDLDISCRNFMIEIDSHFCNSVVTCYFPFEAELKFDKDGKIKNGSTLTYGNDVICTYNSKKNIVDCN